jgi:hypothetical protein
MAHPLPLVMKMAMSMFGERLVGRPFSNIPGIREL